MIAGMEAIPKTTERIERGIEAGLHPGAQVCVWRGPDCVVDCGLGHTRPPETDQSSPVLAGNVVQEPAGRSWVAAEALTSDHLTLWLSAGKPITAVAVAKQVEDGVIDLDDPIVEYVPEFGERGKHNITVRHVLTHTGGFRSVVFRYPEQTWDESIEAVCSGRLETGWEVGVTAGYHPHSGWNILGRVLEICTGQPLGEHLRGAVLEPWGMDDTWVGMPEDVFERQAPRLTPVANTTGHAPQPTDMEQRGWVVGQRPGGNVYGPARDLARFYRALLGGGELDGFRVLEPETLALFTDRHRKDTTDRTFRAVMDWGLGFMPNNARHDAANAETHPIATPYGFGPHASDVAFGHGGNQVSVGFADPEHDLAVAVVFNGQPGEPAHQKRMHTVLAALYEDLGLAE
ncbi:MAG: serine hydrolase domain-containing protein [Planctomycetota bacterium]